MPTTDERAAFEAWVKESADPKFLRRRDFPDSERFGDYCDDGIQWQWSAWQARASLAPSPAAGEADLWALIRAYGDARVDCDRSKGEVAERYLRWAESNLRDALAAPPATSQPAPATDVLRQCRDALAALCDVDEVPVTAVWRYEKATAALAAADAALSQPAPAQAVPVRDGFAGWFHELPSGMSYRLWEQAGADPVDGAVALYTQAAPVAQAERAGWVSVSERLPEKNTEVLIAFAGQNTLCSTGQYTGSPKDVQGWCYPWENRGATDEGDDPIVTHWMPLPAAPTPDQTKG